MVRLFFIAFQRPKLYNIITKSPKNVTFLWQKPCIEVKGLSIGKKEVG